MKPGKNSTEFWTVMGFFVLIIANGTQYVDVPWDVIEALGIVTGVYTAGRSWVKGKAPLASGERRES